MRCSYRGSRTAVKHTKAVLRPDKGDSCTGLYRGGVGVDGVLDGREELVHTLEGAAHELRRHGLLGGVHVHACAGQKKDARRQKEVITSAGVSLDKQSTIMSLVSAQMAIQAARTGHVMHLDPARSEQGVPASSLPCASTVRLAGRRASSIQKHDRLSTRLYPSMPRVAAAHLQEQERSGPPGGDTDETKGGDSAAVLAESIEDVLCHDSVAATACTLERPNVPELRAAEVHLSRGGYCDYDRNIIDGRGQDGHPLSHTLQRGAPGRVTASSCI